MSYTTQLKTDLQQGETAFLELEDKALRAGTLLLADNREILRIVGRGFAPGDKSPAAFGVHVQALAPVAAGDLQLEAQKPGLSLAWVTLSDKASKGLREDESGPAIDAMCRESLPICFSRGYVLPDELQRLKALLCDLALTQGFDLVLTTGGTGLSPRDISPEATLAVIEKRLPGFEQAMMAVSLSKTPHAGVSRAVAGALGQSLIVNLPGSRKAVAENLAAVLPALGHAVAKLQGDPADCGG